MADKKEYVADTEFGPFRVSGKNLKTLVLYTFDGQLSPWKYHSVSTKENNRRNFPYLRKLFSNKHTDTGFAYGANGILLYNLKEVVDSQS